jgi:ubiquinone/menaquinone biosynthesis C-methylase UbiE
VQQVLSLDRERDEEGVMNERTGTEARRTTEAQPPDFYGTRYAPEQQYLRDVVFREVYEDYFGQSSWTSTANYDRFHRWLDVTPDASVLDIACGAGAPALRLARSAGCAVVGIDSSADAIANASALAYKQGLSARVHFERHDASQPLPFPDSAFDAVICIDALGHLPDRRRIFAGWARILKPGGRLLFTDQVMTGPLSNAEIAMRTPSVWALLAPAGYNERLLKEAGFELLRCDDMTANLAEIARRHCAARAAHADALRASEGDRVFEEQNRYRTVAEQLARERRLSHLAFLARKPA